jgi:tetratricopeptide (TPR) repeat protein
MTRILLSIAAALAAVSPASAQDQRDLARLDACLVKAGSAPSEAYEDGLIWQREGGASLARQCIAVALIAQGEVEMGAERLSALAAAPDLTVFQRVAVLSRAANAWLMLRRAEEAIVALDFAIAEAPREPDLHIDRARAHALRERWAAAEADLDQALAVRPRDPLALVLRAQARLNQMKLDPAEADVRAALALDPVNETALLVRGHVREARRTGRAPSAP